MTITNTAIALNGAVILDSNQITTDCSASFCGTTNHFGSVSFSGGNISAVPVPAAAWLFGSALIGFAGFRRKSI